MLAAQAGQSIHILVGEKETVEEGNRGDARVQSFGVEDEAGAFSRSVEKTQISHDSETHVLVAIHGFR